MSGSSLLAGEVEGCALGTVHFDYAGVCTIDENGDGTQTLTGSVGEVEHMLSWCSVSDPETGITSYGDGGIAFTTAAGDSLGTARIGYGQVIAGPEGKPTGFTPSPRR